MSRTYDKLKPVVRGAGALPLPTSRICYHMSFATFEKSAPFFKIILEGRRNTHIYFGDSRLRNLTYMYIQIPTTADKRNKSLEFQCSASFIILTDFNQGWTVKMWVIFYFKLFIAGQNGLAYLLFLLKELYFVDRNKLFTH